ncbi:mitochondrial ADP/ATP-transporter [Cryptosporidium ryanae]|uniref:mitochondrial ADP/ATP-transporter n=1 Tax=Cryptosporidium ryanae TaxID=515981 RepID=UPI00351A16A1|nr:mitochondrial ADP/ATP-transporter [Cryptosporidium ryanae]
MFENKIKELSLRNKFLIDFMVGGISAALSKTAVAPFERVKLLLQTQDINPDIINGTIPRYRGIFDCLKRVSKEQGILSLWRGNTTNVLRYFPTQALGFAFKGFLRNKMPKCNTKNKVLKTFTLNMLSGGLAGAASSGIVYPLDLARTRLATDLGKNEKEFTGMIDCMRKVSKRTGIKSLYNGFLVSIQGIFVYRAAYFGLYDTTKEILFKNSRKDNILYKWIIAQSVTTISSMICYPFDTIRRRMMMMAGKKGKNLLYKNSFDCLFKMIRTEGFVTLYKGSLSNILRGTGGALVLVLYDEFKKILE